MQLEAFIQRVDERWQVTVVIGMHNHEAYAHPSVRELNEEARERVPVLTSAGFVKPGSIVAFLRNDSSINFTAQDIYNIHINDHAEKIQGRTPLLLLLDGLVSFQA